MVAPIGGREAALRATQTINLRVPPQRRDLIDRAARATGKTRTEFTLEAAVRASEEALLDRRLFQLDETAFEDFVAALDAPPRPVPELRRLLAESAPWER